MKVVCCAILMGLFFSYAIAQEELDTVVYMVKAEDGKVTEERAEGKIIQDTCAQVVIKSDTQTISISVKDVKSITYGNVPPTYTYARQCHMGGELEDALKFYDKMLSDLANWEKEAVYDDKARELRDKYSWVKQYVMYYKGVCLRELNKLDEAKKAFLEAKKVNENTKFLKEIYQELFYIYLSQNKLGDANNIWLAFKTDLSKFAVPGELWKIDAKLMEAELKEADREFSKAIEIYDEILEDKKISAELKERTILALFRCLEKNKDEKLQQEWAEKIIKMDIQSDRAKTTAYNVLGDIQFKARKYKDALFSYLRGIAEFNKGLENPENEYAFYGACICLIELHKLERNKAKQEELKDRFSRLKQLFKSKYPTSSYLEKIADMESDFK